MFGGYDTDSTGWSGPREFSLITEKIVEGLLPGFFIGPFIQGLGANNPGLEIIAEVGFIFDLNRFVDPFPAMTGGLRVVESTSPAGAQVGQAGGTMIGAKRLSLDAGLPPAIPAGQTHTYYFSIGSIGNFPADVKRNRTGIPGDDLIVYTFDNIIKNRLSLDGERGRHGF